MKKEALEKEEIYRTPTPEARANSTWLEDRDFEVSFHNTGCKRCLYCW
jgi:hypothetical protein